MHEFYMRQCLELATKGRSKVGNGALVGAILVRSGQIIAQGYHRGFGLPHAEADLLNSFENSIDPNDTLYINLESCCHQGKTPPCTDAIIARGIRRVVIGMVDPDQRVAGQGIATLRAAGVVVEGPFPRASCEYFNRGFINVRTKGRPWITLKMAMDRAQSISNVDGSPKKITSPEQDSWAHNFLRAQTDAILVGVGTIITDDPELTARYANMNNKSIQYAPYRIILDPQLRIPLSAKVVSDEWRQKTIVVTTPDRAESAEAATLQKRGVRLLAVPLADDHFDWNALWSILTTPDGDFHGITSILVEGGRRTWQAFRNARMVDEEVILVGTGTT